MRAPATQPRDLVAGAPGRELGGPGLAQVRKRCEKLVQLTEADGRDPWSEERPGFYLAVPITLARRAPETTINSGTKPTEPPLRTGVAPASILAPGVAGHGRKFAPRPEGVPTTP